MGRSTIKFGIGAELAALSLTLAAAADCGSVTVRKPPSADDRVITCTITRQECALESANAATCTRFAAPVTFTATACATPGQDPTAACAQAYCAQPADVKYPYQNCTPSGNDVTDAPGRTPSLHPVKGICSPNDLSSGQRTALITYTQRSLSCRPSTDRLSCASFAVNTGPTTSQCGEFTNLAAVDLLKPPAGPGVRSGSVSIASLVLNSPACPLPGETGTATKALTAGTIGTVMGGGTTTPVRLLSGFATVGTSCDPATERCSTSIDRLRANLADATVLGTQIRNVVATNIGPLVLGGVPDPDSGAQTVPAGGVNLALRGLVNGVDSFFLATNTTPWSANLSGGNLNLRGALDLQVTNANGQPLFVTMNVNVNGTPANSTQQGCAALSPLDRLFGFEDPLSWSSTNATLSLVTSPITQGCGALGVMGQGYMAISGASFSTAGLNPTAALSVDLFVPPSQPNPFWTGALQMYLTCPSGNVFNQYIGQVELTGRPQNRYSTLRFPLPAATQSTLRQSLNDCAFAFALNVNQTSQTWILDNLRFTP